MAAIFFVMFSVQSVQMRSSSKRTIGNPSTGTQSTGMAAKKMRTKKTVRPYIFLTYLLKCMDFSEVRFSEIYNGQFIGFKDPFRVRVCLL